MDRAYREGRNEGQRVLKPASQLIFTIPELGCVLCNLYQEKHGAQHW